MKKNYHFPDRPAPVGTYVLEVYALPASSAERMSRNDPSLSIGNRWFRLRKNLFRAAKEERETGNHVDAYYVVSDDLTETVRV